MSLTILEGHAVGEPFRTIIADCPWRFADTLGANTPHGWRGEYAFGRGAERHYRTMDAWDIAKFPLPPLAPDCRLFLWRVAAMQPEALTVASAWGFVVKAELVWLKMAKTGAVNIGMGHNVRNAHEVCLIGTKGSPDRLAKDVPSFFFAPRGAHSSKPEEFYRIVERLSPGPYVELFARRTRPGWECLGNEVEAVEGPLFTEWDK